MATFSEMGCVVMHCQNNCYVVLQGTGVLVFHLWRMGLLQGRLRGEGGGGMLRGEWEDGWRVEGKGWRCEEGERWRAILVCAGTGRWGRVKHTGSPAGQVAQLL